MTWKGDVDDDSWAVWVTVRWTLGSLAVGIDVLVITRVWYYEGGSEVIETCACEAVPVHQVSHGARDMTQTIGMMMDQCMVMGLCLDGETFIATSENKAQVCLYCRCPDAHGHQAYWYVDGIPEVSSMMHEALRHRPVARTVDFVDSSK
ncbi:hypothetical protein PTI98_003933 [Pleurotus ostreatus]|nr:hypothetical protein PTI98_003933 [Pleurotus ostreatus]